MSGLNHLICPDCWQKKNPERAPCAVKGIHYGECCFCKTPVLEQIWVRHDPKDPKLACKGVHEQE